jgi:hypothetical protein
VGWPWERAQQAGQLFRMRTVAALQFEYFGSPEHAPQQQQLEDELSRPKQKGLTEPLGHWHWKWGRPATSVIIAVSQPNPTRVILLMAFIISPCAGAYRSTLLYLSALQNPL